MDKKFLSFGEDVGKQFAKMQNDTPMESNYECTLLTKQSIPFLGRYHKYTPSTIWKYIFSSFLIAQMRITYMPQHKR